MKKRVSIFIFSCFAILTTAQNSELWGTIRSGGTGKGSFYKTDSNGDNLVIVDSISRDLGEELCGTLTLGSNGKIYAVTRFGGAYNNGTLIEYDPGNKTAPITKKVDFNRTLTGASPEFAPIQAENGKLYGTTKEGGTENAGTIYEYDPATGAFTKKFDFTSPDGQNPNGLIEASNNKLYGLTKNGGSKYSGVLFEFDPLTGVFTKKSEFYRSVYGSHGHPDGNLIQASNGKLYGLAITYLGATNKEMTIGLFEYDIPTDTLTVKFVNTAEDHQQFNYFCGSLVEMPGGKLYGFKAYLTGIFEYDLATSSFNVKYKCKADEATRASLILALNGKLYGLSRTGGPNRKGLFFEYDHLTATYTSKFDFNTLPGAFYLNEDNNKLLEVCKSIPCPILADTIYTACEYDTLTIKSGLMQIGYTFQWYKDGKIIDKATSANLYFLSLSTTDAGVYSCKVSNGCRAIQTQNIVLKIKDCLIGIVERDATSMFTMYPNPATDQVTIQLKNNAANTVSIELIDLIGRSVYKDNVVHVNSENSASLNIAGLTKGIYLLKVTALQTNAMGHEKLVIE